MAAELVVVKGQDRGAFLRIGTEPVEIGRSQRATLTLDDTKASSHHVKITPMSGERYLLEDLESTNGTWVNDEAIEQVPLRSGDLIRIGRSLIVFRAGESAVRLEDVALAGGGNLSGLGKGLGEVSSASALRLGSGGSAKALHALVAALDTASFGEASQTCLEIVRNALGARRTLLFQRHPLTGGLGQAAGAAVEGKLKGPVFPKVLQRALAGEACAAEMGAAAPVRVRGEVVGLIYADGFEVPPTDLNLLASAGVLLGMQLGLNSARQLASSATEIVALAQASLERRPTDLSALWTATERLLQPTAEGQGLSWEAQVGAPLWVQADALLLGRGLDKLVEHVIGEASSRVRITCSEGGGRRVLELSHDVSSRADPAAFVQQVDPEGVAADLRRAAGSLGEGTLAVARVALLRAGVRFQLLARERLVVHRLEFEIGRPPA